LIFICKAYSNATEKKYPKQVFKIPVIRKR